MPIVVEKISSIFSALANRHYVDILANMPPDQIDRLGGASVFMHHTIHQFRKIAGVAALGRFDLMHSLLEAAKQHVVDIFSLYMPETDPAFSAATAAAVIRSQGRNRETVERLRKDTAIGAALLDTYNAYEEVGALVQEEMSHSLSA